MKYQHIADIVLFYLRMWTISPFVYFFFPYVFQTFQYSSKKSSAYFIVFIPKYFAFFQRRQWHPTPVLLPGKSRGWRSLVCCPLWGRTESDTTEVTQHHFTFLGANVNGIVSFISDPTCSLLVYRKVVDF